MNIPSSIATFWDAFCAEMGEDCSARFFEAFHFDDNEADADALADLVLAGVKQATASLVWSFENTGGSPPKPGALSVVTCWDGTPVCVIARPCLWRASASGWSTGAKPALAMAWSRPNPPSSR